MAKIVFLQRDPIEWLGIMYLSSMLKSRGHRTSVVIESLEPAGCTDRALAEDADVYAFSPLATDYRWALRQAGALKGRSSALVAMGGTHVTLNPEETIAHPGIDVICLGEGEHPVLELADAIDSGASRSSIPNLWVKDDGEIHRNDLRHLIEDLDSLPFPDRILYSKYAALRNWSKRPLHIGRGCPFSCSYCHNESKRELFAHKGRYVRWRTVDNVLDEVRSMAESTSFKVLHFVDDGFGLDRRWLADFLPRLSRLVETPPVIFASMRADMVTEELCATFSAYGPHLMRLRIAVECGDEAFRREVLNKSVTDAQLRQAAELFHRHGIEFATYNIVGLPGESLDQALATLDLNLELRPSEAICFIFQPFPGTRLAQLAHDSGTIDADALTAVGAEELRGSYESFSPLDQENIVQLENVQRIFGLVVRAPAIYPLFRRLVAARWLAPLFNLLYRMHLASTVRRRRRVDGY
jgi:radical SAM superfamily enzyme YgiQ (UPF0313 family)